MKTLILILAFASLNFAQQPPLGAPPPASIYKGPVSTVGKSINNQYTNSRYGFSLNMPAGSKSNADINREMKFLSSYVCTETDCGLWGVFSVSSVQPAAGVTQSEIVKLLQDKQFQNKIADELVTSFGTKSNATILSKQYSAYNGRPGLKIGFNFTQENLSFTGEMVQLFVEDKSILVVFAHFTVDFYSNKWNEISDKAIRSFALLTPPVPQKGDVLTIKGDKNLNARDYMDPPPSVYPPPPPPTPMPTSPSVPKTVSGGVLNGKATSLPQPVYPPAALAVRAGGSVSVAVKIDENGNVVSASAVSGHPLLKAAAEAAARKATFNPTRLQGVPVSVTGVLIYNFIL